MKRIVTILLLFTLLFSLVGCGPKVTNTERQIVDAIVIDTSVNTRWGYHYITVAYGEAEDTWYDEHNVLYPYFKSRLGETIACYLITQTYENGKVTHELVFNEDLWNHNIPEGESE